MRVTGGTWRGIPLFAPEGNDIRPTSDKARQAIFNSLMSHRFDLDMDGALVLDGTAGTGAMGIEALSRGAGFCHFADPFKAAQMLVKKNLDKVKATKDQARIHPSTVQTLEPAKTPCHLIFLDPPYGRDMLPDMVLRLLKNGWADGDTLFVLEEDVKLHIPLPLDILDRKLYGAAQVLYCRMPK